METALVTGSTTDSRQVIEAQTQAILEQVSEEGVSQSADFLSFKLENELYGVEIKDVEEIRVWERPTPIPRAPQYVKGVINLRGMIVPVIDLRCRFEIGTCEYLPTTVVIVLRLRAEESERLMGLVVDAVSDVVSQGQNELYPSVGESLVTPYLQGLMNVGDQVMSLLNTEELLNIDRILRRET
ncbi:chemotaxis protein CheW [Vibrio sp. Isolate23]|uniref:chemotaxis protein CheW n=1 Tax=Vibrio TaxID=662 RepID=UPI001EFC7E57|nr:MULTISPECIES: chemotaxis protein CheW [Vibrio]MCG9680109.1 chemotaxis protein CheW [Vibrio sp. Isolate24]MCG9681670.1 chemotaxis protein CheW [Vibrio sp. Isolate23]USD34747.1 purine-binding chemotaxis protein CheW [Vibrio sp. SCSIO 43186]USD47813.1 purine-binding chemotaxis protein CheW [Vibrio sp. SCSIO 43145]USD71872.1 purine-binding chemotaxis protein CheW [Vibrio sp. SCSIO 43139]